MAQLPRNDPNLKDFLKVHLGDSPEPVFTCDRDANGAYDCKMTPHKFGAVHVCCALVVVAVIAGLLYCYYSHSSTVYSSKASAVRATPPPPADQQHVVPVTSKKQFDQLAKDGNCIAMIHADWCGHCQQAKPEFLKAAAQAKTSHPHFVFAEVNGTNPSADLEPVLQGVAGFPTYVYCKTDGQWQEAPLSSRSADGVLQAISA